MSGRVMVLADIIKAESTQRHQRHSTHSHHYNALSTTTHKQPNNIINQSITNNK